MGSKLEKVRDMVRETDEIQENAIELGEGAKTDITQIRDILSEVPQDVDDDIMEAVEATSDESTREATDYMNTDVKGELEKGAEIGREADDFAGEQAGLSHEAADSFGQAAGIRFGEGASDARAKAETAAENFEGQSEEVQGIMEENQSLFEDLLSDVMG